MFITTSNQDVANNLIAKAKAKGINPNSIFAEPLGSSMHVGNAGVADDLITLIRYAIRSKLLSRQQLAN